MKKLNLDIKEWIDGRGSRVEESPKVIQDMDWLRWRTCKIADKIDEIVDYINENHEM